MLTNKKSMESNLSAPIIILGMHRSGTSLLADVLSKEGFFIGNELNVHSEAKYFLKENKKIMKVAHAFWDYPESISWLYNEPKTIENIVNYLSLNLSKLTFKKEYWGLKNYFICRKHKNSIKWGWKEPQTMITFPLWLKVYPEAKFIFIYRNGIDVANSLNVREIKRIGNINSHPYSLRCLDIDQAFKLWEEYNSFFFNNKHRIHSDNLITISYEELLKEPEKIVGQINNFANQSVDSEKIKSICKNIKSDNAYKFLKSDSLMTMYERYHNSPMMEKLNYNNIKKINPDK